MAHDQDHPLDCTTSHVGCEDCEDFDATADQHGLMPKADKIKLATIEAGAEVNLNFGAWTDEDSDTDPLVKDAVYQVTSDGFVVLTGDAASGHALVILFYTDGNNPPVALRLYFYESGAHLVTPRLVCPVKSGDYWKVLDTNSDIDSLYWLPIGAGECEIQP